MAYVGGILFTVVVAKQTYRHTYIHTDRQTDRQTDRHTDRQTDRQTDTYRNIQTQVLNSSRVTLISMY